MISFFFRCFFVVALFCYAANVLNAFPRTHERPGFSPRSAVKRAG